jgi:hypothetical protein
MFTSPLVANLTSDAWTDPSLVTGALCPRGTEPRGSLSAMGFLRRFFGSGSGEQDAPSATSGDDEGEELPDDRPRVTVWIRLGDPSFTNEREQQRVFQLENRIIKAVEDAGAGTYDTNELVNGAFGMRLVGNLDALLAVVRPMLGREPAGSYLTVRQGGSNASEERVEIDEDGG